ncbi:transcriptional regulator FilR1 domain-containing protein [Natronobacterium texcoconense]|uniref:transcriptional regulator FilR1 domain-containing protein n=1 Tax=Natronobacterium texcoconense TaxID=1095778 RepID=UPI000B89BBFB|nr:transcriptional regulator FilR1 domain-containing protein [Natronobacterium texcoconense]
MTDFIEEIERAEHLQRLTTIAKYAPNCFEDIPAEILMQCEVNIRESGYPNGPLEKVIEIVQSATEVYTFAPTVTQQFLDAHRTVLEQHQSVELVIGSAGLEGIRSSSVIDLSTAFNGVIYVYDGPTEPIGLVRTDDHVIVLVYDEHGTVHGIVFGNHDQFRTWGASLYEKYRKNATVVSSTNF